jgi:hypothetical protein
MQQKPWEIITIAMGLPVFRNDGGRVTDHAVVTSTSELLAAVARLSDDELLVLDRWAWRLANESSEESGRPRIVEVIRRCGVVLAEEQCRRRALVDVDDCADLDSPSTD